jgi:nucleotide-binding universal stress UspA family protein
MKFLVAMDSSEYAYKIANYLAATVRQDVQITLFTVLDTIPDDLTDKLKFHPNFMEKIEELRKVEVGKASLLHEQLEKCKKILVDAGIPEENIKIHAASKKTGIARDIISEAERGEYDTVVVGRRGVSAISSFIFGSVSNKVVHHLRGRTVWIVE